MKLWHEIRLFPKKPVFVVAAYVRAQGEKQVKHRDLSRRERAKLRHAYGVFLVLDQGLMTGGPPTHTHTPYLLDRGGTGHQSLSSPIAPMMGPTVCGSQHLLRGFHIQRLALSFWVCTRKKFKNKWF